MPRDHDLEASWRQPVYYRVFALSYTPSHLHSGMIVGRGPVAQMSVPGNHVTTSSILSPRHQSYRIGGLRRVFLKLLSSINSVFWYEEIVKSRFIDCTGSITGFWQRFHRWWSTHYCDDVLDVLTVLMRITFSCLFLTASLMTRSMR